MSIAVLAILIVCSRWIKVIPGGLVAVVGMIALSRILDFSAHDISILGHVPSGLPHIGVPQQVSFADVGKLAATSISLFLVFLTQPLQYLPDCVLSSVVFLIGLKPIDIKGMRGVYRLRRDEFWVALATGVVVAVGVEQGIILALLLSLVLHVRRHYQTVDVVLGRSSSGHLLSVAPAPGARTEPGLVVFRFGGGVFYANATRLSDEVLGLVNVDDPPRWFVFDCAAIDDLDYTGGKTLAEIADQLHARGVVLAMCEVDDKVRVQLDTFGITPKVGTEHIYETAGDAIEAFQSTSGP